MNSEQILKELKNRIFEIESNLNGYFREEYDQIYVLFEQLEESLDFEKRNQKSKRFSSDKLQKAEEALRASEERLRLVVTNANALIFIIDKNGIITLSEGKALNLFKFLPNQIVGISIFDIYDDKPEVQEDIRKALSGTTTSSILEIQDYIFETVFSPIKDLNGNIEGIVAIAINITERVKLEREKENLIEDLKLSSKKIFNDANRLMKLNDNLITSEEKLKKMNDEKDKFISIISHDLRSPFGGILGITDNLICYFDKFSQNELKSNLELLNTTCHSLFELLENLLLWARANRGKMTVNKEKIPLFKIVKANIELLINNAISKRISINNTVQKNISVFADENMLNTVLRNLISNAIKFTNVGGEISVSTHQALEDNRIEIYISDNGIGIPPNVVENLFNLNRKYTSLGTNKEKGTGLGLLICKEMIEQQDGRIWVESKEGEGTCFKIELGAVKNNNDFFEESTDINVISEQLHNELFSLDKELINDNNLENLSLLINEIEEQYIPECMELSETQILGDIGIFASNLKNISIKYNCMNVNKYAEIMLEKVKMMDIIQLNKYLEYFPILINQLKEFIKNK